MLSIVTDRLILRDVALADEPAMAALRMDPRVTQYNEYILSCTPEEVHAWIASTIDHNSRVPRFSWNLTIVRREDGAILGWIGIGHGSAPERGDLDFGYALLPAYWGQGYAAEALRALLDWCFCHLDIQRIYGECDVRNPRSARVMLKAGMVEEPAPGAEGERRFGVSREEGEAAGPTIADRR
ncbi:MAG: GNAT family N-acetyltransferase [Anaerolineae bacterium]